ncbi:hypothetical protein AXF42_Ash007904 [Apostasia shenzhenica]|uniref:Uncharacterized protein n=1 Tax=Apostasia shenzhenica TaxID=1088818 RepID=A0A2I0B5N6_9ASPA|nr:hypothetical protein AXF42_Ash007904 [Apostasia shenzhenica]
MVHILCKICIILLWLLGIPFTLVLTVGSSIMRIHGSWSLIRSIQAKLQLLLNILRWEWRLQPKMRVHFFCLVGEKHVRMQVLGVKPKVIVL